MLLGEGLTREDLDDAIVPFQHAGWRECWLTSCSQHGKRRHFKTFLAFQLSPRNHTHKPGLWPFSTQQSPYHWFARITRCGPRQIVPLCFPLKFHWAITTESQMLRRRGKKKGLWSREFALASARHSNSATLPPRLFASFLEETRSG